MALATYLIMQGYYTQGLYRFKSIMDPFRRIRPLVSVCVMTAVILIAVAFGMKVSEDFSRIWAVSWIGSVIGFSVFKSLRFLADLAEARRTWRFDRTNCYLW